MRFEHDGIALWYGTPDAPAPANTVPVAADRAHEARAADPRIAAAMFRLESLSVATEGLERRYGRPPTGM